MANMLKVYIAVKPVEIKIIIRKTQHDKEANVIMREGMLAGICIY